MHRRHLITAIGSLTTVGLAGCLGHLANGTDPNRGSDSADGDEPTRTLTAGGYTVHLSAPRVRPSVTQAGVHLDVRAEPGHQFLVVHVESAGTELDDVPLSLRLDGSATDHGASIVGWPDSPQSAPVAVPVPVDAYETATLRLAAEGTVDRWQLPADVVSTFDRAPSFRIESLTVPDAVDRGDTFEASFTVANGGDRTARFLAEFGHGLVSDTGEVALTVPGGETKRHTAVIDPPDEVDPDTIPVILDWGTDRIQRRVRVT